MLSRGVFANRLTFEALRDSSWQESTNGFDKQL